MTRPTINPAPPFPSLERALDILGGKWKLIILGHLAGRTRRFNELRRLMPAITQRMLTLQLRALAADGLVHRKHFAQVPPRVEYSLTTRGETLIPILTALDRWGAAQEGKAPADMPPIEPASTGAPVQASGPTASARRRETRPWGATSAADLK